MSNNSINEHVDSFLHNLKILVKEAYVLLPNNPSIYRANKRINLLINVEPKLIIEKAGEKLYKYKDYIYDASTEVLLEQMSFSEDITPDTSDLATLLINEVKICLRTLTEDQKKFFRKVLCDLLDDYLDYMILIST
jgi:hypothetical protein